jgi:hypothetical protein
MPQNSSNYSNAYNGAISELKIHLLRMTFEGATNVTRLLRGFIEFVNRHSDMLHELGVFGQENTVVQCIRDIRDSFANNVAYINSV